MAIKMYADPADNKAFVRGVLVGRRATGEDWARVRLELDSEREQKEQAWVNEQRIADAALDLIAKLQKQIDDQTGIIEAQRIVIRTMTDELAKLGRLL